MAVLSLVAHLNRDTVELFESMSELSKHNEVRDVMLAFIGPDGQERVAMTGIYRHNSAEALKAVLALSAYLTQTEAKVRGAP